MSDKDAVLDFNGYMHRLSLVVSNAKSTGHKTKIALSDVLVLEDMDKTTAYFWPSDFVPPVDQITVLYRHMGKYVVLTNRDKVLSDAKAQIDGGSIVGYVISTMGLKKSRIADDQIPDTVPQFILDARNNQRTRQGNTDWLKHGSAPARSTPPPAANQRQFAPKPARKW